MKPEIEINGRYFVEALVKHTMFPPDKCIYKDNQIFIRFFQLDQSLPIGKCWVELEMAWEGKKNDGEYFYQIKPNEGKAVVFTELPISDKPVVDILNKPMTAVRELNEINQSPDELAEEVFKRLKEKGHYELSNENSKIYFVDGFKAGQEYHRRMSEGMFTKDELAEEILGSTIEFRIDDESERMDTIVVEASIVKCMQEYHRRMSNGSKQEINKL